VGNRVPHIRQMLERRGSNRRLRQRKFQINSARIAGNLGQLDCNLKGKGAQKRGGESGKEKSSDEKIIIQSAQSPWEGGEGESLAAKVRQVAGEGAIRKKMGDDNVKTKQKEGVLEPANRPRHGGRGGRSCVNHQRKRSIAS